MSRQLWPSDINYSQDSISCHFDTYKKIGETLDDLCERRIYVSDIPIISVSEVKGQWITENNRRLWVFRHLERLGKCRKIPVRNIGAIPYFRMTSKCGGKDVNVRGDPGGQWYKRSKFSILGTLLNFTKVVCVSVGVCAVLLFALGITVKWHEPDGTDVDIDPLFHYIKRGMLVLLNWIVSGIGNRLYAYLCK